MNEATKVADLDLAAGITELRVAAGTPGLRLLVRLGSRVLGELYLRPAADGTVTSGSIAGALATQMAPVLLGAGTVGWLSDLARTGVQGWNDPASAIRSGLGTLSSRISGLADERLPSMTVAVCTRDRADDLERCLTSIAVLDYPEFEVVVVDNAPSTDATRRLVHERFPEFRYVIEPRAGLNWARNRALLEAGGEVIAYTDDDVLVDGGWLLAYGRLFAASPELAAATGTVVPAELEYRAQRLFEAYGGFLRGWQREWYRATGLEPAGKPWHHGAGRFGTGANMAFRRDLLSRLGGFDPALDVGTPSDGGGDLEMYFRVLQEGHALAYSPDAIVRHRHRRELHELERQLRQWGIGFGAFMERSLRAYPEERRAFRGVTRWWWGSYFPRRVLRSLLGRSGVPLRFAIGEAAGLLEGRRAFAKAVRFAAGVSASLPNEPVPGTAHDAPRDPAPERTSNKIAVRTLELTRPLRPLKELAGAAAVEGVVTMHGLPVARCRMVPEGGGVGVLQQRERIGEALGSSISKAEHQRALEAVREWVAERRLDRKERFEPSVSVVISTADRPDDLRTCLTALSAQRYTGRTEIVVVDNRPASGMTPPVVAEFPGVRLVSEPRAGASYGRNAGIHASTGEIIAMTDDDVIAPPEWLETLVAPFARPDIALVTGNVLPIELETPAQRRFEQYGGLGKGFRRLEFSAAQFARRRRPIPTWEMGATANCALRSSTLSDPAVGLLEEALGAGTPTGGSEDAYLYYRLLRAGWTAVYEPAAWVWHRHRRSDRELERQIHAYSRGHVAYHLTILLRHRDFRALRRLMLDLPLHDARSLWRLARGRNQFPFSFIRAEIGGHLTGAWALWRSSLRVRRLGRSAPLERLPTGSVSAGPGLPSAEMHPPDPKKANGRRQSSSASSPRERHPQGADEPDTPLVGSAPDNT